MKHFILAAFAFVCLVMMDVTAQQPAVKSAEPKTVYRLSPMASKKLDELNAKEAQIRQAWDIVQSQKEMLFIGGDIPEPARGHCVLDGAIYVCAAPAPSPK